MLGLFSGGMPNMSGQEKDLLGMQSAAIMQAGDIINSGYGNFNAMLPALFQQAGYNVDFAPQRDPAEIDAEIAKLQAQLQAQGGGSGTSPLRTQLEDQINRLMREKNGGLGPQISGITPNGPQTLDFAQIPGQMPQFAQTPGQSMPLLEELNRRTFNTLFRNAQTFDPNRPDPFVEEQLRQQRLKEERRMAQRMGTGADVSSAGLESLSKLGLNETLARDAARRSNYDDQLKQFSTLGGLGLQSSGELYNRRMGLRDEQNRNALMTDQIASGRRAEHNQNILGQEGFRQQRLSELLTLSQASLPFAGQLSGNASQFSAPLSAYFQNRQAGAGPTGLQALGGLAGTLGGAFLGGPGGAYAGRAMFGG